MDSKQIAAKRGWQTLADGAIVVGLIALFGAVSAGIAAADGWSEWLSNWESWSWDAFENMFVAGGTAVVAWLRRRFVQTPDNESAQEG